MSDRMIEGRLIAALLLTVGLAPLSNSAAWSEAQVCPRPSGQKIPFDTGNIVFDSVQLRYPGEEINLVHCVKFDRQKPDSLIDWPDADIRDVGTQGGYLVTNRPTDNEVYIDRSTAYVGVNRKEVHPSILKEKNLTYKFRKLMETYLFGSISTAAKGRPDRDARLVPVDLRFVVELKEPEIVSLGFENRAVDAAELRFSFPEDIQKQFPELSQELRITSKLTTVTYKLGTSDVATRNTPITFRNSERQELAIISIGIITARQ